MIPLRNFRRFFRKTLEQPFYAVKVGIKRVIAYFYYDFFKGKAPMPESITIFLTHKCNLRCKMCGQWGDKGVTKTSGTDTLKQELLFDDLKKIIDHLETVKSNITLFGGEPFIYKNILPLIEYIKSKNLHCLVITNGSLLKPIAERIVLSGLDELNLSLDGNKKTHDEIRGVEGLFDRIYEGAAEINLYKEKHNLKKPLINLQCTISKDNFFKIEEMIDTAKSLKVNSLTFHHLIFLNDDIFNNHQQFMDNNLPGTNSANWKGFIFEHGIDIPALINKINSIKKIKTDFFVNFFPNLTEQEISEYYTKPDYLPKSYEPRCISPWVAAYIFPDGEVRPCLNLSYSFGNLMKNSLKTVWNSDKAVLYRKTLKKHKLFPACIRCTELFRY